MLGRDKKCVVNKLLKRFSSYSIPFTKIQSILIIDLYSLRERFVRRPFCRYDLHACLVERIARKYLCVAFQIWPHTVLPGGPIVESNNWSTFWAFLSTSQIDISNIRDVLKNNYRSRKTVGETNAKDLNTIHLPALS